MLIKIKVDSCIIDIIKDILLVSIKLAYDILLHILIECLRYLLKLFQALTYAVALGTARLEASYLMKSRFQ